MCQGRKWRVIFFQIWVYQKSALSFHLQRVCILFSLTSEAHQSCCQSKYAAQISWEVLLLIWVASYLKFRFLNLVKRPPSCDLPYLCMMWLQLTCAFESLLLQAVWTWLWAWIDYKQTQDQPHSEDRMKVWFHRIRINLACSHRIAFVHNLSQKMCFISLIPCCTPAGFETKTAVGKSWNECLIIKNIIYHIHAKASLWCLTGECWRGGGHHAAASTVTFPGQLSRQCYY